MTKQGLAYVLAEKQNMPIGQAMEIIECIFNEIITGELAEGNDIKIRNFGSFGLGTRKQQVFKNPNTKEVSELASSKRPVFTPSKALKRKVNKEET